MYTKRILQLSALAAVTTSVLAGPIPDTTTPALVQRGPPGAYDDLVLFDAPAFQNGNGGELSASFRSFVYIRQINTGLITGALTFALEKLGVKIGNKAHNLLDRTKLFVAIPRQGVELDMQIPGCNNPKVGRTDKSGLFETVAKIGTCGGSLAPKEFSVRMPGFFSDREPEKATIFPSLPDGFGVVSDVDDTIKVSNVLDVTQAIQHLLIDDHEAVAGMPEFYSRLNTDLNNPAWFYLTGSPYQLYPSLRSFIFEQFPQGPMIVQNLTFTDVQTILKFITDDSNIRTYKVGQLDRLQSFYPKKKFVTIGDSTQFDPESYAEAARRHPEWVQCIFIRAVAEADNSEGRFAEAFKGVPASKWKVFNDPSELANLDIAGGQCN